MTTVGARRPSSVCGGTVVGVEVGTVIVSVTLLLTEEEDSQRSPIMVLSTRQCAIPADRLTTTLRWLVYHTSLVPHFMVYSLGFARTTTRPI